MPSAGGTRGESPRLWYFLPGALGLLCQAPASQPLGPGLPSLFAEISALGQFILSASVRGGIEGNKAIDELH